MHVPLFSVEWAFVGFLLGPRNIPVSIEFALCSIVNYSSRLYKTVRIGHHIKIYRMTCSSDKMAIFH